MVTTRAISTIFGLLLLTSVVSARRCRLMSQWNCGQQQTTNSINGFQSSGAFPAGGGSMSVGDRMGIARKFIAGFRGKNFFAGGGQQSFFSPSLMNADSSSAPLMFDASPDSSAQCAQFASQSVDPAQDRHASFLAATAKTLSRASKARRLHCITETITSQCGLSLSDIRSFRATSGGLSDGFDSGGNGLGVDCSLVGEDGITNNCNDRTAQRIRTFGGECNNLQRTGLGSDGTIFERLLDPVYDDGLGEMRTKSITGSELPNGRVVSTCTSPLLNNMHPWMSQVGALFGQFITHDLVLTPPAKITGPDDQQKPPKCCGIPTECLHEDCFPIPIPPNDEVFSRIGKTCMEFVRSVPALRVNDACNIGHREQLNQESHLLDLSVVYGSTKDRADGLRANQDGLLRVSTEAGAGDGELLPAANDTASCKRSENGNHACFQGGEQRTNENPVLIALQIVYLRAHNRLARGLKRLADQIGLAYNDEALFQTARKILIAMNQHITYNEFLPIILGQAGINNPRHQLQLCGRNGFGGAPYCSPDGFYQGYSSSVSPQIIHEFSTAAFRLHTLVPDEFVLGNQQQEHLGDEFFTSRKFYETDQVSNILSGTSRAPCQYYDQKFVRSLRDELFRKPGDRGGLGLDLLTLNIYRGRDHGLNGYNVYREKCGLGRARSWSDLRSTSSPEAINALRCAYTNVEDIDLFAGCIAETPTADAVVGPTASCIISEQFQRTRQGDRFWYENPDQFDQAQLREIRKTFFSTLVCATTNVQQVFSHAMLLASRQRESPVPCSMLARMDLSVFLPIVSQTRFPNFRRFHWPVLELQLSISTTFYTQLSEFSSMLGVSQTMAPSRRGSTPFARPSQTIHPNFRSVGPTTFVHNNNQNYNKFTTGGSNYFGKYFPKKASTFTSYKSYTQKYNKPWSSTYTRPSTSPSWSPAIYRSSSRPSIVHTSPSYSHATSYATTRQYNPYNHLFGYWRPQQWKPQPHTPRFSYLPFRSNGPTFKHYYDAMNADELENLTAEKACLAFVEQIFDQVKKPKELEKEVSALQKKDLRDPSPLILQCCYREYKHKILPKAEAKNFDYPEPKGFDKGKSCKDVVKGLLKLVKNDYPKPPPGDPKDKNATSSTLMTPAKKVNKPAAEELVSESFP